jgi:hypothetical protein
MSRIFVLHDGVAYEPCVYLIRVPDEMVGAYRTLFWSTEYIADFDEAGAVIQGGVTEWDDFWPYNEDVGVVETPEHACILVAIMANGKSFEANRLRVKALPHLEGLFALALAAKD